MIIYSAAICFEFGSDPMCWNEIKWMHANPMQTQRIPIVRQSRARCTIIYGLVLRIIHPWLVSQSIEVQRMDGIIMVWIGSKPSWWGTSSRSPRVQLYKCRNRHPQALLFRGPAWYYLTPSGRKAELLTALFLCCHELPCWYWGPGEEYEIMAYNAV